MAEGTEVGTGYVSLVPSAAGFGSKLQQLVTGEAGQAGTKAGQALGSGITGQASSIARSVGGVFAAVGAARFLKGAIGEAENAARVGRLTEAVIKSTGGAAGVTAAQVDSLAVSLSKVAGVDDELIQGAENVLLTFTSVRNAVGAGNDVFNRATTVALDMSAALGTDLQGSVIQLGKALNDPVQGMTALRRVGVSFTEQQVAQVKAMQDSNNLLGAQKIVLDEVNREFGGAAAAGATSTAKLGVAVGNLKESLGSALLPTVNVTTGALTGLVGGFSGLPGPIRAASGALVGLAGASVAVGLIAPKVRAARLELEGLGLAGGKASAAFGLISKGALTLGAIIASVQVGEKIAGIKGLDKQVADLAATTDEKLNKAFHGTNNELKGWDVLQSVGLRHRHDEFETFAKIVEGGNFALAQRVIASEADLDVRNKLQVAYDTAISQTQQFNADQTLSAQLLGQTGDVAEEVVPKIRDYTQEWTDLGDKLRNIVQSDFSKQLASNLTSALNPLEKFVVGSGAKIDTLKAAVDSAAADFATAKAEVAKLEGTGTTADIARVRGDASGLDAARATLDQAADRLTETRKELADASKSPLASMQENLTANLASVTSWLGNLDKLSAGGHESLARHLTALGPQAADAVAEAVGVSPKQLDKISGLFDRADAKIAEAASGSFELGLTEKANPGKTLAELVVAAYDKSIVPGITKATLGALEVATGIITGREGGAHLPFDVPGERGPHSPPPLINPALGPTVPVAVLPAGAPLATTVAPTPSGITFAEGAIKVYPVNDPKPAETAAAVGDHIAWRLAPTPTLVG